VRPLLAVDERDALNEVAARPSFIAVIDRIIGSSA
jgi:hypothetical protein